MKPNLVLTLFATLVLAFSLPTSVAAADDGIFYGDTIPAGTVVEHDVVLFGKNVLIEGTVNGNVFILGNQVIVNGIVDGSLVLIAQNAAVGGEVSGTVYAAALTLDLPARSMLERDLYATTVSLTSGADSAIGRHLYALGLDAGLNGQIGGDLHTALGPIQLYNGLMRLLGFDELTLELHFEVPAPDTAPQGFVPLRHLRIKFLEPLPPFDWGKWGLALLHSWAVLFIFGLLGLWLARKPLERSSEPLRSRPWQTLGIGLVVLVVAFNLFIVGLLLFIIIFAIGLGLNFLGLWQVTLALWVLAFSALFIALVGLGLFIAIGSKVIVVYLAASLLFDLFIPRKAFWINLLALLAGTVVYALLQSIPYAGWIIDLLVTSAGMGAAWMAWRASQQKPIITAEEPVVAARKPKKKVVRKAR
jgi:cytoskeletal protein CcmA (bactofilin family)